VPTKAENVLIDPNPDFGQNLDHISEIDDKDDYRDDFLLDDELGPPPSCTPEKNRLMFLKTHKTASSVIENILYRYGLNYNKTFAMPKDGGLVFNYKKPFQTNWIKKLPSGAKPDILSQHIRYSEQAGDFFPPSDSYRITIVRDPGHLFPSLFKYFGKLNKPFARAGSVENFISDPAEFTSEIDGPQFMTRNSLSFQMGFDNFLRHDPTSEQLDEIMDSLDDHFDLVMVADHMDESLILLRHMLCLSFNDIATLSKNKSIRKHIDDDLRSKVRDWETVDEFIFERANRTLWKKVEQFGTERMKKEVRILNSLNDENSENCVSSYKSVKSLPAEFRDYEPPGVKIEGIELKEGYTSVCYSIALSPFALAIDIQDKQCQDSTKLRKFAKLMDREKTYGLDC
jgi:hypothetical protein